MGYSTDYFGQIEISPPASDTITKFINKFCHTRRVKRKVSQIFGPEGAFYIYGNDDYQLGKDKNVIDYNSPPHQQPGVWCDLQISKDGKYLEWNGNEKTYELPSWIDYLIEFVFKPNGYILNGDLEFQCEDEEYQGMVSVKNNNVEIISDNGYEG